MQPFARFTSTLLPLFYYFSNLIQLLKLQLSLRQQRQQQQASDLALGQANLRVELEGARQDYSCTLPSFAPIRKATTLSQDPAAMHLICRRDELAQISVS